MKQLLTGLGRRQHSLKRHMHSGGAFLFTIVNQPLCLATQRRPLLLPLLLPNLLLLLRVLLRMPGRRPLSRRVPVGKG